MNRDSSHLILGTRGSLLAIAQSQQTADALMRAHPGLRVELRTIKTSGDRIQDRSLADAGGKGLFVKELELALLSGVVDFAVHSYKDLPVTMPLVDASGLTIAAVPTREEPADVAVLRDPAGPTLPEGARFGTSSLRRQCLILEAVPGATVQLLRGNIDSRLRKLRAGEFDVILLAAAGLKRAGLYDPTCMRPLDPGRFVPSPTQGALALQCRRDDERTLSLLRELNDPVSERCVAAERALVAQLAGDCHSPIGALAQAAGEFLHLVAAVGARDGALPVTRGAGSGADDEAVVRQVFDQLVAAGGVARLHGTVGMSTGTGPMPAVQ